ncbi:MAG TPA: hypothetical protein VLG38_07580, partial [Gammaproteobacteria bacterium]|nr:hypothetical protein [Gammaproteobacteria bacterium]
MHKRLKQDTQLTTQYKQMTIKKVTTTQHHLHRVQQSPATTTTFSITPPPPPFWASTPTPPLTLPVTTAAPVTPQFTLVTANNRTRLHDLADQTSSNLTNNHRDIKEYKDLLNTDIKLLVKSSYDKHGPITILDAGCGKAIAMQELLKDTSTGPFIKSIIGISKDHFGEIKRALDKYPEKFIYYNGKAEVVLAQHKFAVHIIFDVWGAFTYSLEKMLLLQQYYAALELNGKAYIYVGIGTENGKCKDTAPSIILDGDETLNTKGRSILYELPTKFPQHFTTANS